MTDYTVTNATAITSRAPTGNTAGRGTADSGALASGTAVGATADSSAPAGDTAGGERVRLTALSHGAGCACKLPLSALDELMATLGTGRGQPGRSRPGHG